MLFGEYTYPKNLRHPKNKQSLAQEISSLHTNITTVQLAVVQEIVEAGFR